MDPLEGGTENAYAYANDPVNGFDLDGKAGWFDSIRKGVQNAAKWAWKNRETIATVASIGLMFVPGIGAAAVAVRVAATAIKIAKVAKAGGNLAQFGRVGKVTSNLAGRIYTGRPFTSIGKNLVSRDGLRQYRPPVYKVHAKQVQSNFERYRAKPVSNKSYRYPNRVYNGHLNIFR